MQLFIVPMIGNCPHLSDRVFRTRRGKMCLASPFRKAGYAFVQSTTATPYTPMPISSVQQLEALRTQLDELIEAVSSSQIDLPPLDESKPIGAALEPQHPRLSTFAASLRHVLAVIEGPRDVLNQAFAVRLFLLLEARGV